MLHGWTKARDLAKLAELKARFEYEIPLGDLPGIPEEFALSDEPVRVAFQFGRERALGVVEVKLQAVLRPICQRCLSALRLEISSGSRVVLVEDEAAAEAVPEPFETFLAPDGHGSLAALAAEELLLSLPLVPRHGPGERCVAAGVGRDDGAVAAGEAPTQRPETQRPFADLRALLERG